MAERGPKFLLPRFLLIALPTLALALGLALAAAYFRPQPRSQPQPQPQPQIVPLPFSGPAERHFLGSVSFDLPAGFQVTSGRLQLFCQGPPSLTRVREIPTPPLDRTDQLTALVPADPPPFDLVEAEADFGRPALWAFARAGPDEVMAHLLLGFQCGTVILSRLFPADRLEIAAFTDEAREFAEKYAWGHEGAGPGDRYSLHGRLRLDQTCRRLRGKVKFTAPEAVLEIFWPGEPEDLPDRRLIRPRLLDGRPGQESVSLDPGSADEAVLTAVWQPEAKEEAVLLLSAPAPSAALALGYWDAILDSVRFLEPELAEGPVPVEREVPEPVIPEQAIPEPAVLEPMVPAEEELPKLEAEEPEVEEPGSLPTEETPPQEAEPQAREDGPAETPQAQDDLVVQEDENPAGPDEAPTGSDPAQSPPPSETDGLEAEPAAEEVEPPVSEGREPIREPEVPEIQAPVREHGESDGRPEDTDHLDEWMALGLDFPPEEEIPDGQSDKGSAD